MSRLRPVIDESVCAAHGDCEVVAPNVFVVTDVARIIGTGPDDLTLLAAQECPSVAIRIVDEETGEQIYP
jgi:ferredoxin